MRAVKRTFNLQRHTIGKQISNSEASFVPFLVAGVFYFVFNAVVDFVMGRIEKRMSYYK